MSFASDVINLVIMLCLFTLIYLQLNPRDPDAKA
ncbi:hypothetical protein ABIA22_001793 [Sinorhizobium fredii]